MDNVALEKSFFGENIFLQATLNKEPYFSKNELAEPISATGYLTAFSAFESNHLANPKMLRVRALPGLAYRCMMQTGCREGVSKINPIAGENMAHMASGIFVNLIKQGDENATRDFCLFAIKGGTSYKDMIIAGKLCESAIVLIIKSNIGIQTVNRGVKMYQIAR